MDLTDDTHNSMSTKRLAIFFSKMFSNFKFHQQVKVFLKYTIEEDVTRCLFMYSVTLSCDSSEVKRQGKQLRHTLCGYFEPVW